MRDDETDQHPNVETGDTEFAHKTGAPFMPELLVDIELEATLRFGSREMTLGEVLDLGPGDVIELDRQVDDAVDLLVGDKIIARGLAVLCNGKYGIRVTEVSELRMSLESVHCLF